MDYRLQLIYRKKLKLTEISTISLLVYLLKKKGSVRQMKDGFIRIAAASPEIKVTDCEFNKNNIISMIKEADQNDASLIVFPELCVTAYT